MPISQILVEDQPATGVLSSNEVGSAHYWLRWQAGELLITMSKLSKITLSQGARPAEPILVDYLSSFAKNLEQARTPEDLDALSQRLQSGKLIRLMVKVTGSFDSADSRRVLTLVLSNWEKLRHFPFLQHDLDRALGRPDGG